MRNSKMSKVFSWYYIFAFLAIFGLAGYLYSTFRMREGATANKFTKDENVLVLWSEDNKYYPGKILKVKENNEFDIEYTMDETTDEVDATSIEKMPANVVKFAATKCVDQMFLSLWNGSNIRIPTPESEKDLENAITFQSGCN